MRVYSPLAADKRWLFAWPIFAALLVLRFADAIRNPQFWAEDGTFWFAQAFNRGALHTLALPQYGYQHLFARCVAALSQLFPLNYGPAVFVWSSVLLQSGVASYMLSPALRGVFGSVATALLFAMLYIALPNSHEVQLNLTNAHTHLAMGAFLVLLAEPPGTRAARYVRRLYLSVAFLSGPFVFFLIPVAVIQLRLGRSDVTTVLLAGGCGAVQLGCLLFFGVSLPAAPLGASALGFLKIVGGQIGFGAVLGQATHGEVALMEHFSVVSAVAGIAVLALYLVGFAFGPRPLRLFLLFSGGVFGAALLFPKVSVDFPQWAAMLNPGQGGRYYFFPSLALLTVLIWLQSLIRNRTARIVSVSCLGLFLALGIVRDWRVSARADYRFADRVEQFHRLSPGQEFQFQIPPGWTMRLIRRK